ncbi:MAG: excinuclease ABC subunit UvrB [Patescibacteria group bacterium]
MNWRRINQLSRHVSPRRLFRVGTACGRSAVITGDHNFYALREGSLKLLRTEEIKRGDYLPIPRSINGPRLPLEHIDLASVLIDSNERSYFATLPPEAHSSNTFADRFSYGKRFRVIKYGERVGLADALQVVNEPELQASLRVGAYSGANAILRQLISDRFLRLIGYYIAEGHAEKNYFILSTADERIIDDIRTEAAERGFTVSHRPDTYDYQCNSALWTDVMRSWCGKISHTKRLPPFWPQLADGQLAQLLRAYFSADGGVEKAIVSATTVSGALASDILYALLRFGIVARMRRRTVKIPNRDQRGLAWRITISGRENLIRFSKRIGFVLPRKSAALAAVISPKANTNVDIIPLPGRGIRSLRVSLNLLQRDVAKGIGVNRSFLSMIERGKHHPSVDVAARLVSFFAPLAKKNDGVAAEVARWRSLLNLFWSPVEELSAMPGERHVYDFSIEENETFLAGSGGMFVHNTFTMANVIAQVKKPTLVIAHNKTLAAQLCNEFREFFPSNAVEYFVSYYDYYQPEAYLPSSDTYIEKEAMINQEIDRLRHAATQALLTRDDVVIVASVSCIYGLGAPETYEKMHMRLKIGQAVTRGDILRHLVTMQFERTTADLKRGSFRNRGDVFEIMPVSEEIVYRVELSGQKIGAILAIDPVSRKLRERLKEAWVFPAKHFITAGPQRDAAIKAIRAELKERLAELTKEGKLLEVERLERRTNFDLAMLREVGYCHGIENYSRHLSGRAPGSPSESLLAYFPKDFITFIDESHVTVPQIQGMYFGDAARKKNLIEYGFRLPSAADNRPLTFDEFEARVPQAVFVSATPSEFEFKHSAQVVEQVIRPTGLVDPAITVLPVTAKEGRKSQIDDLLERIPDRVKRKERTLVTTLTKKMAEDLTDYMVERKIKVAYLHSDVKTIDRVKILTDLRRGVYDVLVGVNLLREGLDLPEVTLIAILDADKEGFLRSETSLIQTIGRAARNVRGEVILYADAITGSMRRAMAETERRRNKQIAFNAEHGITPRTIEKAIKDIMEGFGKKEAERAKRIAALDTVGESLPPEEIIVKKEKEMRLAAKNLEFELAAVLRDEIRVLKKSLQKK